jgi:hypothetical protein
MIKNQGAQKNWQNLWVKIDLVWIYSTGMFICLCDTMRFVRSSKSSAKISVLTSFYKLGKFYRMGRKKRQIPTRIPLVPKENFVQKIVPF